MLIIKSKDQILKPIVDLLPNWITPNGLAVFRIFMVIPIGFFALHGQATPTIFLLLAAYLTDLLDGVLARTRNQVTKAGAVLDPIADKVIFLAMFWILGWRIINIYIFGILATLELVFLISGPIYSMIPKKNFVDRKFGANIFGKLKTFFEVIGLILLIFGHLKFTYALLGAETSFGLAIVFCTISFFRHISSRQNIDD